MGVETCHIHPALPLDFLQAARPRGWPAWEGSGAFCELPAAAVAPFIFIFLGAGKRAGLPAAPDACTVQGLRVPLCGSSLPKEPPLRGLERRAH